MNSSNSPPEWATYKASEMGIRVVPPDALIYFTPDEYVVPDADENPCDNKLVDFKEPIFDYNHDLKKFRSEVEEDILKVTLQHLKERQFSNDAIKISDISKHFEPSKYLRKRFGLLNYSDTNEISNLLQGFQEGLEEELTEMVDSINDFIRRRCWANVEQQVKDISMQFQPSLLGYIPTKDPRNVQNSHLLKSPFDPYVLPRVPVNHMAEHINVDLPRNDIVTREALRGRVVATAMRILLKYPLGICPNRLETEMKKFNLNIDNFEDFLQTHSLLFQVTVSKNLTLVFPNRSREIRRPYSIGKEIFHQILIIVKFEKTPIPLEEIPDLLREMFGVTFNPYAWGSNSDLEFYTKFLQDYDVQDELEIFEETSLRLMVEAEQDPVKAFCEELIGEEELGRDIRTATIIEVVSPSFPEYTEFATTSVKIPSIADRIEKGKTYFVVPDFMRTPMELHVSLTQNWKLREEFVKEMTKYDKWTSDPEFSRQITVLPDFLQNISNIAVKSEREWVRGKIIDEYDEKYTVYLIDLGYEIYEIPASDIKYLHKDFINDNFPAQAFTCAFRRKPLREVFPGQTGPNSIEIPEAILNKFYDMLEFRNFGITTLARVEKTGFWVVNGFLVDNVENRNIIIPDLVTELIGKCSLRWKDPSKRKVKQKFKQPFRKEN